MEASLNHWPLVISSTSSPSLLPGGRGDGAESPNSLIPWLVPLVTSLHPMVLQGLSKNHLIDINSGVVERGLL